MRFWFIEVRIAEAFHTGILGQFSATKQMYFQFDEYCSGEGFLRTNDGRTWLDRDRLGTRPIPIPELRSRGM